jgi:hypothetical protein
VTNDNDEGLTVAKAKFKLNNSISKVHSKIEKPPPTYCFRLVKFKKP